jgi:hypothetical protein
MLSEAFIHIFVTSEVAFEQLAPLDELAVAFRQVVEDDRVVASCCQFLAAVGADVAGTAGDEDFSQMIISYFRVFTEKVTRFRKKYKSEKTKNSAAGLPINKP